MTEQWQQHPGQSGPVYPPPGYGPPPVYAQAPRRKRSTGTTVGILLAAVVMVGAACGIGYAIGISKAPATATAADTAAPTSTSTAKTTAKAKTSTVLPAMKGSGGKNTPKFTTGADWTIHYSFNCAGFGSKGNFQIYVYDGTSLGAVGVNDLAAKGSGTAPIYGDSGSHYLTVNSECSWTVSVTSP